MTQPSITPKIPDPIHNTEDIIDSRDVVERIEWLEGVGLGTVDIDDVERDELKALRKLAEEASSSPDWIYGAALIRDSYFEDYAQELAEDCGLAAETDQWPNPCIDWSQAARELQHDYTLVDFDGVDYWIRA